MKPKKKKNAPRTGPSPLRAVPPGPTEPAPTAAAAPPEAAPAAKRGPLDPLAERVLGLVSAACPMHAWTVTANRGAYGISVVAHTGGELTVDEYHRALDAAVEATVYGASMMIGEQARVSVAVHTKAADLAAQTAPSAAPAPMSAAPAAAT